MIAIVDGDIMKVRCGKPDAYEEVMVRLAEVDAPEKRQPFGETSRDALVALCFHQEALITPQFTDRFKRTVAKVTCQGQDAGTLLVQAGLAWNDIRHAHDPQLKVFETQARDARLGLWSQRAPIAPWEWRKEIRTLRSKTRQS